MHRAILDQIAHQVDDDQTVVVFHPILVMVDARHSRGAGVFLDAGEDVGLPHYKAVAYRKHAAQRKAPRRVGIVRRRYELRHRDAGANFDELYPCARRDRKARGLRAFGKRLLFFATPFVLLALLFPRQPFAFDAFPFLAALFREAGFLRPALLGQQGFLFLPLAFGSGAFAFEAQGSLTPGVFVLAALGFPQLLVLALFAFQRQALLFLESLLFALPALFGQALLLGLALFLGEPELLAFHSLPVDALS